jgi:hypothetical protein
MQQPETIRTDGNCKGVFTHINKKFIFALAGCIAFLDWVLFLVLVFFFDDHFNTDPPPGLIENTIGYTLWVLGFPVGLVAYFLNGDPPYFFVSGTLLFFLGGIVWGIIIERCRFWMRRGIDSSLSKSEVKL